MMRKTFSSLTAKVFVLLFAAFIFGISVALAEAATMSLTPGSGVYTSGATFTARVVVNSGGQSINAAEGTLKFNPNELTVVGVNRSGSIFNLWVAEPSFSNSAGTISFSGGAPTGYNGGGGNIMTVTFRAKGSGTAKVTFTNGSVLANDGRGSNVLSGMNGGTYTLQAGVEAPVAEEIIVEYVAPANTPAAPNVSSKTHPDPTKWYTEKNAELGWSVPSGVTAVRTLLDNKSTAIPTKVYETPISNISIPNLDEGVSYFHIQFKNADGWGKVTHYRLAVDSEKPSNIEITQTEGADLTASEQELVVKVDDSTSEVKRFMVKVNGDEPFEIIRDNSSSTIKLPPQVPGYHTVVIEAFDEAGNSIVGSYSFTIASFERPVFTEYPTEINEEVIPVIKGKTRPNSTVEISVSKIGSEVNLYDVASDDEGNFTFIPEGRFTTGVYELTARATDVHGAQSEISPAIKIVVQQPGYVRVGSFIISILSIIIPLIALTGLTIVSSWYMFTYLRRFKKRVQVESTEALEILHREFTSLQSELRNQESSLRQSRKTNSLTKAEAEMIETFDRALQTSQRKVEKEIEDVTKLTSDK
jgi:hypothetical protein